MSVFESVGLEDWLVTEDVPDDIRSILLDDKDPRDVIIEVGEQVEKAINSQRDEQCVSFYNERMTEGKRLKAIRTCAVISIQSSEIFDRLFNGRSGYRSMYWCSESVGEEFNAQIIKEIVSKIKTSKAASDSSIISCLNWNSLSHSDAKIWPFFEKKFRTPGHLAIERWSEFGRGNNIFDSSFPIISLKGAFLDSEGMSHGKKLCRSRDLMTRGFT